MVDTTGNRRSLLASGALIQAPWVKVTFGEPKTGYTFGVYKRTSTGTGKDAQGFYSAFNVQYPNFINSLSIVKINGQVNQYTLDIQYPVRSMDDPNFFEKVISSISQTHKIIFSYGDSAMPTYCYKDEEAIVTKISSNFNFGAGGSASAVIGYTISAVSSSILCKQGNFTFIEPGLVKPSDVIKKIFRNSAYGLQDIFKGMSVATLNSFIDGSDAAVKLEAQTNVSPLDYISYLVSCMTPAGRTVNSSGSDVYILTLHDDTTYDKAYNDTISKGGPYFKVERVAQGRGHDDAYEIDIGYDTNTIVTSLTIDNQENYSIYYDYTDKLYPEQYTARLNNDGQWEQQYAPVMTSKNSSYLTRPNDITWFNKMTKFPISAQVTVQGLLRPAHLMQYVRLNIIFPGGNKHINSGLYIVTKQVDSISQTAGFKTTLSLTRISD